MEHGVADIVTVLVVLQIVFDPSVVAELVDCALLVQVNEGLASLLWAVEQDADAVAGLAWLDDKHRPSVQAAEAEVVMLPFSHEELSIWSSPWLISELRAVGRPLGNAMMDW